MLLSAAAAASAAVMTVCWLLILPAGSASKSTGSDAGSRLMKRRCFSVQHVNNMTGIESALTQWHSAGSLGWPFRLLKDKYSFHIKYTETIFIKQNSELGIFYGFKLPKC